MRKLFSYVGVFCLLCCSPAYATSLVSGGGTSSVGGGRGAGNGNGDFNDDYNKCINDCTDAFNDALSAANKALQAAYDALSDCHSAIDDVYETAIGNCPDAEQAPTAHAKCVADATAAKDSGYSSCHDDFQPGIDAAEQLKADATAENVACIADCLKILTGPETAPTVIEELLKLDPEIFDVTVIIQ